MKRIFLTIVAVLAGMVAVNAAVHHAKDCGCLDGRRCKTSLGTPCEMVGARTLPLVVISERLTPSRQPQRGRRRSNPHDQLGRLGLELVRAVLMQVVATALVS